MACQKLDRFNKRRACNDFDRFKVMVLRKQRSYGSKHLKSAGKGGAKGGKAPAKGKADKAPAKGKGKK